MRQTDALFNKFDDLNEFKKVFESMEINQTGAINIIYFQDNLEILIYLIDKYGEYLDTENEHVYFNDNLESLKYLYDKKVKFSIDMLNYTKKLEVFIFLSTKVGMTIKLSNLEYHIQKDNYEIVKYIIENYNIERDLVKINSDNLKTLQILIDNGYTECLSQKLSSAAFNGNFKMVKFLVENNIKMEKLILVYVNNRKVYNFLVDNGATPSDKDILKRDFNLIKK